MQGGVNSWSVPSHAEEIFEWSEGPAGRGQWCATARVGAPTPPPPRGLWPISVSPLPHNNQTLSATLCFSVLKTLEYKSFSKMKHLHYWKSGNIIIQKYFLKVVRSELSEDQTGWKQTNTPDFANDSWLHRKTVSTHLQSVQRVKAETGSQSLNCWWCLQQTVRVIILLFAFVLSSKWIGVGLVFLGQSDFCFSHAVAFPSFCGTRNLARFHSLT